MTDKIFISGVKPTGNPHIGNYFGAMKQFVEFQAQYGGYVFIADYHALNLIQNKEELRQNIINVAIDYLAIGLDPKKIVLFKQSDISAHTELCWIFDTITTIPYLMRAHAFKDAEAKNNEINVGTFNYPMLMAADILLYDANIVPVGKDQKQHIEYARDTALKFNRIFGETFVVPDAYILDEVATVPGIDGQKMSKSYNNTISLFASDEEIRSKVMSIVTDSSSEIPQNVYAIHSLLRNKDELDKIYSENKGQYKVLKEKLIEDLIAFIAPMRERRAKLAQNPKKILKILEKGAKHASKIAEAKMKDVRNKIGVCLK